MINVWVLILFNGLMVFLKGMLFLFCDCFLLVMSIIMWGIFFFLFISIFDVFFRVWLICFELLKDCVLFISLLKFFKVWYLLNVIFVLGKVLISIIVVLEDLGVIFNIFVMDLIKFFFFMKFFWDIKLEVFNRKMMLVLMFSVWFFEWKKKMFICGNVV